MNEKLMSLQEIAGELVMMEGVEQVTISRYDDRDSFDFTILGSKLYLTRFTISDGKYTWNTYQLRFREMTSEHKDVKELLEAIRTLAKPGDAECTTK